MSWLDDFELPTLDALAYTSVRPLGMQETRVQPEAFEGRPCGSRTYRPHRQRTRVRLLGDKTTKDPFARRIGQDQMEPEDTAEPGNPEDDSSLSRDTLCLPDFSNDALLHGGEKGFTDVVRQYFPLAESKATARLVDLKRRLRKASTYDFWGILMEEICDITGAQCSFVAKRMLVDDQNMAVEMPELGQPGSCLMGVAFYLNNGSGVKELFRDYRYQAYGTPCAHMKHDKVFIVPEKMSEFVPNNPNKMPWPQSEAFIGIPLFMEDKCFGHFCLIWSLEGASKKQLSWTFIEMFMHSLEDLILQRIEEGRGFAKDVESPASVSAKLIPLSSITASQSLKPYARSLSHELRTPMQGVVGMLDIMYSTVLDAIETQKDDAAQSVFEDLKSHIEVVQESSKRVVEAADNVVHAYALNMQMPETPLTPMDGERTFQTVKDILSNIRKPTNESRTIQSPQSKKRERPEELDLYPSSTSKRMFKRTDTDALQKDSMESTASSDRSPMAADRSLSGKAASVLLERSFDKSSPLIASTKMGPTQQCVNIREFLQGLISDCLKSGRPTSEIHIETDSGETIEVKTIGSKGEMQEQKVHLKIEPDVPEVIITEEQHLHFSTQKIIDNAIKFTDGGSITVTVKLGENPQMVEVRVADTGCGIAEESKQRLFQPHFQEDASISRSRDGLGLSLFNAKANVRKNLRGDVTLERSSTGGPSKGSEFLISLPVSTLDSCESTIPRIGARPLRPSPLLNPVSSRSIPSPPASASAPAPRTSPPRAPGRRVPHNPALAKAYPLNFLIAEDNVINRNMAIASLTRLGYSMDHISVAFDGVEAVALYKASLFKPPEERIHAILMDIWMPNMDGYAATSEITSLANANGEKLTIIAVTADITDECAERAKKVGMQGFVAKPYKVLDIEHLIIDQFEKA